MSFGVLKFLLYRHYPLVRAVLFRFSPEVAHSITLNVLTLLYRMHLLRPVQYTLPKTVMGLRFPNPIGLAAGFDKDGRYIDTLAHLGFGFIEVGTVTPKPQPGKKKPRLFRLIQDRALINRMGFNNSGTGALVNRLQQRQSSRFNHFILGINIGKYYETPIDEALGDYLDSFEQVYPYADYITVNISSPNTQKLRTLQYGEQLANLLSKLKAKQLTLTEAYKRHVPLVLKISPDLKDEQVKLIANALLEHRWDGIIASNTSTQRINLHEPSSHQTGGLSGKPLFKHNYHLITLLAILLQKRIALIAVGGIMSEKDAEAYLDAGADLVQLYTGLIYQGPKLLEAICIHKQSI